MVTRRNKAIILEYLRNDTSLDGKEIMTFERMMKQKGIF